MVCQNNAEFCWKANKCAAAVFRKGSECAAADEILSNQSAYIWKIKETKSFAERFMPPARGNMRGDSCDEAM